MILVTAAVSAAAALTRTTTRFTFAMEAVKHIYEVRSRKDHRGVDLISDALPFGRLWYDTPSKHMSTRAISKSSDAFFAFGLRNLASAL